MYKKQRLEKELIMTTSTWVVIAIASVLIVAMVCFMYFTLKNFNKKLDSKMIDQENTVNNQMDEKLSAIVATLEKIDENVVTLEKNDENVIEKVSSNFDNIATTLVKIDENVVEKVNKNFDNKINDLRTVDLNHLNTRLNEGFTHVETSVENVSTRVGNKIEQDVSKKIDIIGNDSAETRNSMTQLSRTMGTPDRGKHGELVVRNVLNGSSEYRNFIEKKKLYNLNGTSIVYPDFFVQTQTGLAFIVEVKTPNADQSSDSLKLNVLEKIRDINKKEYHNLKIGKVIPIVCLGSDALYSKLFENDNIYDVIEECRKMGFILCSPSSLIPVMDVLTENSKIDAKNTATNEIFDKNKKRLTQMEKLKDSLSSFAKGTNTFNSRLQNALTELDKAIAVSEELDELDIRNDADPLVFNARKIYGSGSTDNL